MMVMYMHVKYIGKCVLGLVNTRTFVHSGLPHQCHPHSSDGCESCKRTLLPNPLFITLLSLHPSSHLWGGRYHTLSLSLPLSLSLSLPLPLPLLLSLPLYLSLSLPLPSLSPSLSISLFLSLSLPLSSNAPFLSFFSCLSHIHTHTHYTLYPRQLT